MTMSSVAAPHVTLGPNENTRSHQARIALD